MRVFMLGWEFPPHISGGLGTACYGMTRGLDQIGVDVCFVLPTAVPVSGGSHVEIRTPADAPAADQRQQVTREFQHMEIHRLGALLQPYGDPAAFEKAVRRLIAEKTAEGKGAEKELLAMLESTSPSRSYIGGQGAQYTGDLMGQVQRYARMAVEIARSEAFDLVHAHDWMTYPAGVAVAAATGKPLVIHVHSTEFDRSGENINQQVYEIERTGMHCAARVVCVSHFTRNIVLKRYGVPPERVEVVYNATELPPGGDWQMHPIKHDEKIVLFLGRMTMQKGPEYFLQAAKKVVQKFTNVRFVMAGSGDMMARCIQMVADLKLGRYVTFTGFLRGTNVDRVLEMADLYVMPSVSEPFGIAPLEALSHNVPVIISKQSGVSEVLTHVLKVDFWDIDEMANKILAVLRHAPLHKTLRQHGQIELQKLSWTDSAEKLKEIYEKVVPPAA